MSVLSLLDRFRGDTTRHGRVGASAQAGARVRMLGVLYRASWKSKLFVFTLIVLFGALAGYAAGISPLVTAPIAAATALGIVAILLVPNAIAVLIVSAFAMAMLIPVTAVYTYALDPTGQNIVVDTAALAVSYWFAVWIAARWSRGRVWVTVLMMACAMLFAGPVLVYTFPPLGLNAARITLAVVLFLRCGGAAWISGAVALAWARWRHPTHLDDAEGHAAADPADISAAWRRRSAVEKATAELLADLPPGYHVFHDVRLARTKDSLGHVVVGPCGVMLIASVHATGLVELSARSGVSIEGVDLDSTTETLLRMKPLVARALRCHPRDVSLVVVVQGKQTGMANRLRVSVHFAEAPGKSLEHIVFVPGELLLEEIVTPFATWSSLKVKQTVHRANMRLAPAVLPGIRMDRKKSPAIAITPLDMDGKALPLPEDEPAKEARDDAFLPGNKVDVQTTLGIVRGLRIVRGVQRDESGEDVIYLCSPEDYEAAANAGKPPVGHPFPLKWAQPSGAKRDVV